MNEIVVRNKPAAYLPVVLITLAGTVIFGWLYYQKLTQMSLTAKEDVLQSVYLGITVFFLLITLTLVAMMLNRKPVLIIDHEGITDFVFLGGKTIPWKQIKGASTEGNGKGLQLKIDVANQLEWTNALRRSYLRAAKRNIDKYSTFLVLPASLYRIDAGKAVDMINLKAKAK